MLHSSLAHSVRRAPASAETTLSHQTTAACRVVLPKRMQLAGRDLVDLDGVRLSVKGAHVFDEAARDRGR